jgi:hypothetical protein
MTVSLGASHANTTQAVKSMVRRAPKIIGPQLPKKHMSFKTAAQLTRALVSHSPPLPEERAPFPLLKRISAIPTALKTYVDFAKPYAQAQGREARLWKRVLTREGRSGKALSRWNVANKHTLAMKNQPIAGWPQDVIERHPPSRIATYESKGLPAPVKENPKTSTQPIVKQSDYSVPDLAGQRFLTLG